MAGTVKPAFTIEDEEEQKKPQFTVGDDEEPSAAGEAAPKEATEENLPGSTPRLRAAVKAGVAPMTPPTQFEKERQTPEWYGFTPSNIAKNVYGGAKGLVTSGAGALYDIALGQGKNEQGEMEHGLGAMAGLNAKGEFAPMERVNALTQKYLTDPAVAEANKANEEYEKGGTLGALGAIGHAGAATLPIAGPWAASLGEQAGAGDIGGAAGQAAGIIGAGELIPKIAKNVPAIADKLARGTPLTEAGKLEAAKAQAMTVKKPSMTETEYAQKVTDAMPELQRIAQDNKGKIKTPRQATAAINDRISQLEAPISEHVKGLTAPEDLVHQDQYQDAISQAVDQELAKRKGSYKPSEIEKAKKAVMDFLGDQPKTYEEIEGNRKRLNQDAEAYFNTDTAGKRAIDVSDATAVAQRAAGNKIRDILYGDDAKSGLLENAGVKAIDVNGQQVPIREIRRSVGRLLDIRDHFEDAITRAEAAGDWKAFDKWRTGPSLAAGGLGALGGFAAGGPVGALFGTLAGEGVKAWADYLKSKNPNLNVEKMFRNLEQTRAPNVPEVTPTAPIHQYPNAIGPRIPQYMHPIGPTPEPPPFEIPGTTPPNRSGLWEQQIGAPPHMTWGAPTYPFPEPIGPQEAPQVPLPPMRGEQLGLNLPPKEAPVFNLPQTEGRVPRGTEPEGTLGEIGGPGRQGPLEAIGERPRYAYRAQDVGNAKITPASHAHATESLEEAEKYKTGREAVRGTPQEVVRIDLGKMKPEDYESHEGPNGKKWFQLNRQLEPGESETVGQKPAEETRGTETKKKVKPGRSAP